MPQKNWLLGHVANMKLKNKLLLNIIVITLASIFLLIYVSTVLGTCLIDETTETQKKTLELIMNRIDTQSNSVYELVSDIKSSSAVTNYLNADLTALEPEEAAALRFEASSSLFSTIMQSNNLVTSCCVIRSPDEYVLQNTYAYRLSDGFIDLVYEQVSELMATRFLILEVDSEALYFLYSPIYQRSADTYYHLLLLVNERFVTNLVSQYLESDSNLVIADIEGRVIYCSSYHTPDSPPFEVSSTVSSRIDYVRENKSLLLYSRLQVLPWCISLELPYETVFEPFLQSIIWLIIIVFFVLLCSVSFYSISMFQFKRQVMELIDTIKCIERGELQVRYPVSTNDEIGQIGKTLNEMLDRINHLYSTAAQAQLKMREAQLSAIQRQINPHFLYNTLETIRMVALFNKDHQAARMSKSLADILRYTIGSENASVTIETELNNTLKYIDIQKIRYKDKFELEVDVEPLILEYITLRIIMQPIVENALCHGIEPSSDKCMLRITGKREGKDVVLTISDNGVGMTEEKLKELRDKLRSGYNYCESSNHIGVTNVNERLNLSFGIRNAVYVESTEGQGTTVTLRFPAMKEINRHASHMEPKEAYRVQSYDDR